MKDKEKFVFPERFLNQINEYSNGGFLLINFDAEKNPCVYFNFDDNLSSLAILSYAENWCQAMKSVNNSILTESLKDAFIKDNQDEDNDEQEL